MTTVRQPSNGHSLHPLPCSVRNFTETNPVDLPTNKANNNHAHPESAAAPVASDDPLVERQQSASPCEIHGDQELSRVTTSRPPLVHEEVLEGRCQLTFSDGRQCRMPRSDIHPSLCCYHAEREEQLFGFPSPSVGPALDLPELYSASRDLTTAAGVNRALAQVFRLLARRRISRQEAATFGHLAQLLLQSIHLVRSSGESGDPTRIVVPSARESHPQAQSEDSGGVHQTPETGDALERQHAPAAESNSRGMNTYEIAGDHPGLYT
jgi:hypothetical protein